MNTNPTDLTQSDCPVKLTGILLGILTEKEQKVIIKRYGIHGEERHTLAAIGEELGVTRERVRQIENYALKKLSRSATKTKLVELHSWLDELLDSNGGIISEISLNRSLIYKYPELKGQLPALKLACIMKESILWEHNKVDYISHFRYKSISFSVVKEITNKAIKLLKKSSRVLKEEEVFSAIQKEFRETDINIKKATIRACLVLDRRVTINEDGVSLTEWRHVNPKTLFDKILYVLNEIEEPMHFREIGEMIKKRKFDKKPVSVQAVHNELINNPIFVLIGRGIYALKTWGYKEGTVSEVLSSILEKKGPMSLEEVTRQVLQRRKVKPITVQINLNSKKNKFRRLKDGNYEVI
jgi:hypothetical protein